MKVAEKILVIRHGALGDFCLATGAMKAIREQHPEAQITLLTQSFLAPLARRLGWFEAIEIDNRSRSLSEIWRICRLIAGGGFDRVYDLQQTHRTQRTYRWIAGLMSGFSVVWARLTAVAKPDLSMVHGEHEHFGRLPQRYALLIPGCSPANPEKRWPAQNYRKLSKWLGEQGIVSVVLGTKAEQAEIEAICAENPQAVNFMGKSELTDIPDLARGAEIVIGNDTGPTHMCRLAGAKTVLLLPGYSRHLVGDGEGLRALIAEWVGDLSPEVVVAAITELLGERKGE